MSDCVFCQCENITPGEHNCLTLQQENDVKIRDFAIMYRDVNECNMIEYGAKGFYNVWCMFRNVIAQLCWLMSRVDCRTEALRAQANDICAMSSSNAVKLNKYLTESASYQRELLVSSNNTETEAYLSKVVAQPLIFKDEMSTYVSASQTEMNYVDYLAFIKSKYNYPNDDLGNAIGNANEGVHLFKLAPNSPLTITYNLEMSSYNGKKLSKAKFTYTNKGASDTPLTVYNSPTTTIKWGSADKTTECLLGVDIKFYDEVGAFVPILGSVLAFNSLNSSGSDSWEGVANFNGDYVTINGSSIKIKGNKVYSPTNNATYSDGTVWDELDNEHFYYGSIAGILREGSLKFDVVLNKKQWLWFSIDTNVASKSVPIQPSAPILDVTCSMNSGFVC